MLDLLPFRCLCDKLIWQFLCQRKVERGEDHIPKYSDDYFSSEDHNGLLDKVEITLIDKNDPIGP